MPSTRELKPDPIVAQDVTLAGRRFRRWLAVVWVVVAIGLPLLAFQQDFTPLDPQVYDRYLGDYRLPTGELLVVGRNERRLYLLEASTGQYRGLERQADDTWVAGPSLLVYEPVESHLRFERDAAGSVSAVHIRKNKSEARAAKVNLYTEGAVSFTNRHVTLAGTLLLPTGRGPFPAVVMVHGSGGQDRNGYVSYIRILADHFARSGVAALIYDKRGYGASSGNWATASFADLAGDALAATAFLRSRADIIKDRVGLAGSSQAGWVIAKAVQLAPDVGFVITISAAGSGLTAAEQNLYNNEVELRAQGFSQTDIMKVLDAIRALYHFVRTGRDGSKLDDAVRSASENPKLRDWLPPLAAAIDLRKRDQWFTALEIDFDPTTAWAHYEGPILAVFGGLDSSTPTKDVVPRLEKALSRRRTQNYQITVFPKGHHLLLEATVASDEELPRLRRFVPGFFRTLTDWIKKHVQASKDGRRQ